MYMNTEFGRRLPAPLIRDVSTLCVLYVVIVAVAYHMRRLVVYCFCRRIVYGDISFFCKKIVNAFPVRRLVERNEI